MTRMVADLIEYARTQFGRGMPVDLKKWSLRKQLPGHWRTPVACTRRLSSTWKFWEMAEGECLDDLHAN